MKKRMFAGAVVIGATCLFGAAHAAQGPAPPPAERVPLTEDVFKSVALLRGIPVDTFFDAMGMFANAMGNDCTFCHASKAYFDKALFAEPTPRIQKARQMIVMVNTLNKQYFGGQTRVTCFTCHQGSNVPSSDPNLMLQYGTPVEDPNVRDFPTDARIMADAVFDKYLEALGGAQRVAALKSFTAKGMYSGFDTSFDKVPVELYGRAPGQQAMVVHFTTGVSTRAFDGTNGWIAGPETPLPLVTLSQGNLDRARLEALASFPAGLRTSFPQWRGGRTAIDDKEVVVLQGLVNGEALANLYFDDAGLLVRMIRWVRTPVGFVPTKIDYSDYREVDGVKVPFTRVVTQTYMQMTVELTGMQPNVAVDASRFAKPAPYSRPRSG
jgi:hypothetical protein